MLDGFFTDDGSPYITGTLIIPELNVRGAVNFLVDTGADSGLIHPDDLERRGADPARLRRLHYSKTVKGIGGRILHVRPTRVSIVFEGRVRYEYEMTMDVQDPADGDPDDGDPGVSLIGRDFLADWLMYYDPVYHILAFMFRAN